MPLITLVRLVSLKIKLKSCHTTLCGGGGFVTKSCPTLATSWAVARQATLFMGSPGKDTGVVCHSLLQGIFPSQGLNLGLLH